MYRKTMALLVAAAVAVGGCGGDSRDPAAPNDDAGTPGEGLWEGKVDAVVADGRVTLKNGTERVIGYLVVEKNMAIVALFPPCTTDCKTLVQGAEVSISYQDIPGYSPGATEAIVYWWMYGSEGRAEGGMVSETVRL